VEGVSSTYTNGGGGDSGGGGNNGANNPQHRRAQKLWSDENHRLQNAAQATIASLKSMLQEKNRTVDDYKRRLDDLRRQHLAEKELDKMELERLAEKRYNENGDDIAQLRKAMEALEKAPENVQVGSTMNQALMDQLDEQQEILAKREERMVELEKKLRVEKNAKMLAEERVGNMLRETDTLREQVTELEGGLNAALSDRSLEQQLTAVHQQLATKEKQLGSLRAALVKLKQEFVKSEEERVGTESARIDTKANEVTSANRDLQDLAADLKDQVSDLEERVGSIRTDLAKSKKREAQLQQKNDELQDELEGMEANEETRGESGDKIAGQLQRARRELDDSKTRESRLKAKIQQMRAELQSNQGQGGHEGEGLLADNDDFLERGTASRIPVPRSRESALTATAQRRAGELERRIQVLEAQNAALRSQAEERGGGNARNSRGNTASSSRRKGDGGADSSINPVDSQGSFDGGGAAVATVPRQRVTGDPPASWWINEKKLKRQADALRKKLEERTQELEAANGQASQVRDLLKRVQKERDVLQRKQPKSGHPGSGATSSGKPVQREHLEDVQDLRDQVFSLETEKAAMLKKMDVESKAEIRRLQADLEHHRDLVKERESEIHSLQKQLRLRGGGGGSGTTRGWTGGRRLGSASDYDADQYQGNSGGGSAASIRQSEERFLRGEQIREESNELREELRRLQETLLERDLEVQEMKYDSGQHELEREQLKLRIRDLEQYRRMTASGSGALREGASSVVGGNGGKRGPGGRFNRERDLEGVVEALRKVVDKQKGELDKLRKKAPSNVKVQEQSRLVRNLQEKVAGLVEEKTELRSKMDAAKRLPQKMAQLEEANVHLKRQLKSKDAAVKDLTHKLNKMEDSDVSVFGSIGGGRRQREREPPSMSVSGQVEELRDRLGQADRANAALQEMVQSLKTQLRAGGGSSDDRMAAEVAALEDENQALRDKVTKMSKELQAFDLEFFEEIEDLKFKYAEALKRLKEYEG
jgi:chromosome segregation ATPase